MTYYIQIYLLYEKTRKESNFPQISGLAYVRFLQNCLLLPGLSLKNKDNKIPGKKEKLEYSVQSFNIHCHSL